MTIKPEDLQNAEDLGHLFIDQLADLQSFRINDGDPVDIQPILEDVAVELEDAQARLLHQIDHWRQLQRDEEPDDAVPIPGTSGLYAVLDYRAVGDRNKRKWYTPDTKIGDRTGYSRLTKKKGVCAHVTQPGGPGGFGISKARMRYYGASVGVGGPSNLPPGLSAHGFTPEMLALGDRYAGQYGSQSGVSYHGIASLTPAALFLNLPFDWVSWHGDGANTDFAGFAFDFDTRYDTLDKKARDLFIEMLCEFIQDLIGDDHDVGELTIHGAWANKMDPGPVICREVLVPVAKETGMHIDYDFKQNGGMSFREMLAA